MYECTKLTRQSFLHDVTIILFRLIIIFTELVLYPFSCRAMVLGSFQCRVGHPTTLAMVGQEPAVLAAGAGRVDCVYFFFSLLFFISSILSSFSNASYLGRRLDILKYCGVGRYNPAVVVSYYWRRAR